MESSVKYCSCCKQSKVVEEFYKDSTKKNGYSTFCKLCTKSRQKTYNCRNKDKISTHNKNYYQANKETLRQYNKRYAEQNKEVLAEYQRNYQNANKIKIKEQTKEYQKKYYLDNRDLILSKNNKRSKVRYKTDPSYAIRKNLASRINELLRLKGIKKQYKTEQLLGCSYKEFKEYLESKFESWMNWENRGRYNGEPNFGWDIDHITPISLAKNEEELFKLSHYTNLQPLCSYVNRCIKKDVVVDKGY